MARATGTIEVIEKVARLPLEALLAHYQRTGDITLGREGHTADGEYRAIFSMIGAIGLYLHGDAWRAGVKAQEEQRERERERAYDAAE